LAIGRRGQNVRLASQLTGWDIDILTEAEESDRRNEEFRTRSQLFIDSLDVDEVIAQLLVTEGFSTIEEVAFVPIEELATIEGFDEELASELHNRGQQFLENKEVELTEARKKAGVSDDVANIPGITGAMLVSLGENNVKSLDDLADLASDELIEILGKDNLNQDLADEIIMSARAHWFEDEPDPQIPLEETEVVSKEKADEIK